MSKEDKNKGDDWLEEQNSPTMPVVDEDKVDDG